MYTVNDYRAFAERLKGAGFTLVHEGFGPNIQRTGQGDPAYVVFLSSDYTRLTKTHVEQQVLLALPEFKVAVAEHKYYRQGAATVNEVWVYLSL